MDASFLRDAWKVRGKREQGRGSRGPRGEEEDEVEEEEGQA